MALESRFKRGFILGVSLYTPISKVVFLPKFCGFENAIFCLKYAVFMLKKLSIIAVFESLF